MQTEILCIKDDLRRGHLFSCFAFPPSSLYTLNRDLHWWCRWKQSSSSELHEEGRKTSSPVGLPPATREQSGTENTRYYSQITCSCCACNVSTLNSKDPVVCTEDMKRGPQALQEGGVCLHHVHWAPHKKTNDGVILLFTWFSVFVVFNLGILLPAVTAGFLTLGKGMTGSFYAPKTNAAALNND